MIINNRNRRKRLDEKINNMNNGFYSIEYIDFEDTTIENEIIHVIELNDRVQLKEITKDRIILSIKE